MFQGSLRRRKAPDQRSARFEHAERAKADRGGRAQRFGEIRYQVEEMIGSHSHQEGDLFRFVLAQRIDNDLGRGIPIHLVAIAAAGRAMDRIGHAIGVVHSM